MLQTIKSERPSTSSGEYKRKNDAVIAEHAQSCSPQRECGNDREKQESRNARYSATLPQMTLMAGKKLEHIITQHHEYTEMRWSPFQSVLRDAAASKTLGQL